MKGYYITYGIFSLDLENIVKSLEKKLNINLIKDEYNDDELYYIETNSKYSINHFSIYNASPDGFYITDNEVLHPKYLIYCNIIFDKNELFDIENIRRCIQDIKYIKELHIDVDEW
jgi:hypothetical protein